MDICINIDIHSSLSISRSQFINWLQFKFEEKTEILKNEVFFDFSDCVCRCRLFGGTT